MLDGPSQTADVDQLDSYRVALQLLVLTIVLLGTLMVAVLLPRLLRGRADRPQRASAPSKDIDVWTESARRMQGGNDEADPTAGPPRPEPPDDTPPNHQREGGSRGSAEPAPEDDEDDDVDFREDLGGRL